MSTQRIQWRSRPNAPRRSEQFIVNLTTLRRRLRFHLRGLLRLLRSVPFDAPLPRPTHDF
jgi:hypothetical protein